MHAYLSLYRLDFAAGETKSWPEGIGAALVAEGTLASGDHIFIGQGTPQPTAITQAVVLCFMLTKTQGTGKNCLESQVVEVPEPFLLRLDEVAFPPGAQAYRHVHPGPGFRHLLRGQLRLEADDHSFDAKVGDTWFEAANSPVRATATASEPETRFVRCMILPPHFQGRPTISILDPRDAERPKRQTTHRHVDRILDHFDAG